ncbi:MAG: hypothetical protein JW724_00470 [Candidatus Altiarchaeota archaeon]|nr:hypothetical protein [Candidatus Altiarchaeota archaeon]
MVETKNLITYGLIVGIAAGLLSSIPIINCFNIFCCMWVLGGGALTAYLINKKEKLDLKYGALAGALSGSVAGIVSVIIDALFRSFFTALGLGMGLGAGGMEDYLPGMGMAALGMFFYVIVWVLTVVIYTVFGAIGGLIAAVLLEEQKKKKGGSRGRKEPAAVKPVSEKPPMPSEPPRV